ncbi:MAG: nitroreductase family protein, partial [Nitrospinota bacterium]
DDLFIRAGCDKETHDRLRGCPAIQSVAGALAHMQLAADALGYGSCWQTGPVVAAAEIEELLGLRGVAQLVALLSVGVPAEEPPPRPRRALEDVLKIID